MCNVIHDRFPDQDLCLQYDQRLEMLWNQCRTFPAGFFCSRSWAVIAQNEILSPHSQMTYSDPILWSSPLAAESTTGLFVIVLLHAGHVIWFSIRFPFLSHCEMRTNIQYDVLLQAKQPGWCKPSRCASCILPSTLLHPRGTCPSWSPVQHHRLVQRTSFSDLVFVWP